MLVCAAVPPSLPLRSILELATNRGYSVEEVPVSVTEAMEVRQAQ